MPRSVAVDVDPGVLVALDSLVEPESRGDPMSPLRWTVKSTRRLAEELRRIGHQVSSRIVGDYANGGVEWQPEGLPVRVDVHDFPDPEIGKAIPFGVYDIHADEGWVIRRRRPRHPSFRGRHHRALVGTDGTAPLPQRDTTHDHRRRWRFKQLPQPYLQDRTRTPSQRHRPDDHGTRWGIT